MISRTKIICTIGPAVSSYEQILHLIDAGMNVARLNFSHGSYENHLEVINLLKKARKEKDVPLAIMLDTKGPEIRVGKFKEGIISVNAGQKIRLTGEDIKGDDTVIPINPSSVIGDIQVGMRILFDDGYVASKATEITPDGVIVEFENPGVIKDNKGINIPHEGICLPFMTEKDIEDLKFGCKHDVDIIAASFICSAEHLTAIKRVLSTAGKPDILVLAKIESIAGVNHFDSILQAADGIMVARGDLGVEMPVTQVPQLQKMMIRKCYEAAKPVVTATQMLESMIFNPRPTRAEVSDVANAIYDSTSAVMLSGETAVGKYPIETVKLMKSVICETEKDFDFAEFVSRSRLEEYNDIASSIGLAVVKTAYNAHANLIVALTSSGSTAKGMSRFRPWHPLLAITSCEKTFHQLAISWGVIPVQKVVANEKEGFDFASKVAIERGLAHYGDLIVLSYGSPFGVSGTTNTMIVRSIGDALVRGSTGEGKTVTGEAIIILSVKHEKDFHTEGKIVILPEANEAFSPYLKKAAGIILQNHPDDFESEEFLQEFAEKNKIPYITRADGACTLIEDGLLITLHPTKKLVFKGKISFR